MAEMDMSAAYRACHCAAQQFNTTWQISICQTLLQTVRDAGKGRGEERRAAQRCGKTVLNH